MNLALGAAERSYPTSEVRGRSREDPMPEGRWPRGVTPRPRSGASAESTRLQRRRNRQEELPHVRIHGGRPRGDTQPARSGVATRGVTPRPRSGAEVETRYPTPLSPRPGAAGGRSNPTSKEPWLRGRRRAWRSYPTLNVRKGAGEEMPLVQGKEQRLRFAGAAMKRYPMPKVRETQVRW